MSTSDSSKPTKIRRDGWTAERQLRFLDDLSRTRSVTTAARAAGMSRESAYRLRSRKDGALFAAPWDRALEGPVSSVLKGHKMAGVSSRRRASTRQISRGNPSKVTKSMKYTNPRFSAFEKLLRDFREMPV